MLLHLIEYQLVSFALKYLTEIFEEIRLFLKISGAPLTASKKNTYFFALKFGQLKNLPYICTHSAADVGGALKHNEIIEACRKQ